MKYDFRYRSERSKFSVKLSTALPFTLVLFSESNHQINPIQPKCTLTSQPTDTIHLQYITAVSTNMEITWPSFAIHARVHTRSKEQLQHI